MIPQKPNYLRLAHWIYSLFILVMASVSINSTTIALNHTYVLSLRLDYLVHFATFIPWMGMVWMAYSVNVRKNFARAMLWICIGILFSWLTEGIQYFIPYRSFNINDLMANTIGVLLGSLFFIFPLRSKSLRI